MYGNGNSFKSEDGISQFCDAHFSDHVSGRQYDANHINDIIIPCIEGIIDKINYLFAEVFNICKEAKSSSDIISLLSGSVNYIHYLNNKSYIDYKELIIKHIIDNLKNNSNVDFSRINQGVDYESQFIQFIFNHLIDVCYNAETQDEIVGYLNDNKCFSYILNDGFYEGETKDHILQCIFGSLSDDIEDVTELEDLLMSEYNFTDDEINNTTRYDVYSTDNECDVSYMGDQLEEMDLN